MTVKELRQLLFDVVNQDSIVEVEVPGGSKVFGAAHRRLLNQHQSQKCTVREMRLVIESIDVGESTAWATVLSVRTPDHEIYLDNLSAAERTDHCPVNRND